MVYRSPSAGENGRGAPELCFPLFERAKELGLLDGGSGLVVAPTATGKSYIGREAVRQALSRGDLAGRPHAYLVPYRALAAEVHDDFLAMLAGTQARVRLLTGDHRDPLRPDQADLVVATYESFAGLIRTYGARAGLVVADEVHLVADEERGPLVEGLLAQLLDEGRASALLALSAIVENADDLARWLKIPLLRGTAADRTVGLVLRNALVDDLDVALVETLRMLDDQALVFCSSRPGAERAARLLAETLDCRTTDLPAPPEEEDDAVLDLLPRGVAYHHAGLPKPVRQHIESLFRCGKIRVITCTPTLAAGVNLPAGVAVVRDVFRMEQVRGRYRPVLLPAGEVLNMLGRAGRPGQVSKGSGIVLIDRANRAEAGDLVEAVRARRGGPVTSQLVGSFEKLMRFVLAVIVERGETTSDDVACAFSRTLASYEHPAAVSFGRTLRDDLMEDLPAYDKARRDGVRLLGHTLTTEGVDAVAGSKGKQYEVQLRVTGASCSCPAASRYYRGKVCKHQALVVHDLLFGPGVDPEARARALYLCGHVFGEVLDIGTRLAQAVGLLLSWGLAEKVPSGWRATELGQVACGSGFDLLLVHQAAGRLRSAGVSDYREIARWAVEDFHASPRDRDRWLAAVSGWLDEVDVREIKLPVKYRGDFERGLERLAQVCALYERAAHSLGREDQAAAAHDASAALRYGVAPPVVPLMALGFPQLRRARARYLYDRGIRDVADLAGADPSQLADPRRVPLRYAADWVERARQIHEAALMSAVDREEDPAEFDELVARFRLDPAAL
jgi:helicase